MGCPWLPLTVTGGAALVTSSCHRWVSLVMTNCHRWVSLVTTDCHRWVSPGTVTVSGGVSPGATDGQKLATGVPGHHRLSQAGSWGHWCPWGRGDAETVPSPTPSFCLLTVCHQASANLSAPLGQGVAQGAGPQPLSEQTPRTQWVNCTHSR